MNISLLTSFSPSFKAIKLNNSEQKKSDNLINDLKVTTEEKSDTIKFQLYELYDKHLQNEVDLKCKAYHIKEDFAQEMFLKFFESLENIRKNIMPIEEFIPFLNNIKPTKNELKSGIAEMSLDQNLYNTDFNLNSILTKNNLPQYLSNKNDKEKKIIQDEFNSVINECNLKALENKILKDKTNGKSTQNIADELKKSTTTINKYYQKAIYKIQNKNNVLPKEIEDFSKEFNKIYEINDLKKVKRTLLEYPNVLCMEKENIYKNISKSAETLKISEKEFAITSLKFPIIMTLKAEKLKENVKNSAETLDVSENEFIKAGLKYPQILCQKSETLKDNVENSSKLLSISKKDFINASLKQPALLVMKSETLKEKVQSSAKLFEISEKEYVKAGLKKPQLLYQNSDTLNKNVDKAIELFNIPKKEYIKMALNCPNLILQKPETLKENLKNSAKVLDISEKDLLKASLKKPAIMVMKPETLKENVKNAAKLFEIQEKAFIKSALREPQLLYQKPETLKENIATSAKTFEIPEKEFIRIALNSPNLFYQKPETLNNNIIKVTKTLNVEKSEIIKLAKTYPAIFRLDPENTVKKIKLCEYYKKLKGKDDRKLSFSQSSTETFYKKNLAYLIKQNFKKSTITSSNFTDYIVTNPDKRYKFELPESELNEEFMQFVQEYFKKYVGKSNVEFVIKNNPEST